MMTPRLYKHLEQDLDDLVAIIHSTTSEELVTLRKLAFFFFVWCSRRDAGGYIHQPEYSRKQNKSSRHMHR